jgi:hypothetical protein
MSTILGSTGAAETRFYLDERSNDDMALLLALWAAARAPFTVGGRVPARVTDADKVIYMRRVSNEAQLRMRKLTQRVIAGTLLLSGWYVGMRSLMKALYLIGLYLAVTDPEENADAWFYLLVLPQFVHFDGFYNDLRDGRQFRDGTAMARAGQYGRAGNAFYQNVGLFFASRRGMRQGRRILGPTEDHCHDTNERQGCLELAGKGWIPLGDMVPIGDASCYSNCLCTLEYRA